MIRVVCLKKKDVPPLYPWKICYVASVYYCIILKERSLSCLSLKHFYWFWFIVVHHPLICEFFESLFRWFHLLFGKMTNFSLFLNHSFLLFILFKTSAVYLFCWFCLLFYNLKRTKFLLLLLRIYFLLNLFYCCTSSFDDETSLIDVSIC